MAAQAAVKDEYSVFEMPVERRPEIIRIQQQIAAGYKNKRSLNIPGGVSW
jgi:hypothetical protein